MLSGLAHWLPAPWSTQTWRVADSSPPVEVLAAAVLAASATLVWGLLAWTAAITILVLLARMPGIAGERARSALGRLWPALARRALATTVGASLLAGGAAALADALHGQPAMHALQACAASLDVAATTHADVPMGTVVKSVGTAPSGTTPSGIAPALVGPAAPTLASLVLTTTDATAERTSVAIAPSVVTSPGTGSSSRPLARHSGHRPIGPAMAPTPGPGPAATHKQPRPIDIDWPTGSEPGESAAAPEVVVLRGDSLWSIAERHLPPRADDAQIDRAWRAWYAANRAVIGPDANQILPGQRLTPPAHTQER